MKETEYFKLFAHNVPVKGEDRSVIYNLQKADLIYIPNSMYDVVSLFETSTVLNVKKTFKNDDAIVFQSYLAFLIKNELGFFTEDIEEYPNLSKQWKCPNTVLNSVIEYDFKKNSYEIPKLINELDELLCLHIEIRIKNASIEKLKYFFSLIEGKVFRSISLIIEYDESFRNNLDEIFEENKKLESIIVYNTNKKIISEKFPDRINYFEESPLLKLENENFPLDYYVISIKYFTEALNYHPYYNKKVCVNNAGDIKNCLRHNHVFGNINSDTINSVLENSSFKDLWNASPDKVIQYKDDELRYCKFYTEELRKISNDLYEVI